MKIGIDLKPFMSESKYRGIGGYSRNLIEEMINKKSENKFHFLNLYGKYENDPQHNREVTLHSYYTGSTITDGGDKPLFLNDKTEIVLESYVKHFLNISKIEVMLFTSPNEFGNVYKTKWFDGILKVAILYDLIPLIFPEQCLFNNKIKDDYYKSLEFLKEMDLLLAISQSAKDDAVKLLGIPEEKIKVIYAGVEAGFKKSADSTINFVKNKFNITEKYLLFAGGIDFKKNIPSIIESLSLLPKKKASKLKLVIIGKTNNETISLFEAVAKKNKVEDKVVFTGFVSQDELIALYSGAEMLVFPSLYEGFGLPIIEAMLCETLVLTSNNSSLKEIAIGQAGIVNPKSVKSIAKGISDTLTLSEKEKTAQLANAHRFASDFTWQRVASESLVNITKAFSEFKYDPQIFYELKIDDLLLKNIVNLYVDNALMIKASESKMISQNLSQVEAKDFSVPANMKQNRIIFDITVVREWFLSDYSTGIGRVCRKLIENLSNFCDVLPVANLGKEKLEFHAVSMDNFSINTNELAFIDGDIYLMPEIQLRDVQIAKKYPSIASLKQKNIPCYAIVYDILPILMPEYFEKKTIDAFPGYIKELIANYDGILSDSRSVSDTIINYAKSENLIEINDNLKLGYFHLGFDSLKKKSINTDFISEEIKSFFSSLENIFLMVGTIEPRKGHDLVLEAFEEKWKNGSEDKLCIIGNAGWNTEEFVGKIRNHPYFGEKLVFYESAKDEILAYAYDNSSALIQASAGEGFGLPLIEAASYNIPILCTNISVFREVCGENAIFFERSVDGILNAISLFGKSIADENSISSQKIITTNWQESARRVYDMIVSGENWYALIKNGQDYIYLKEGEVI